MILGAVDVSSYLPVLLLIGMAVGFAVVNIVLTRVIGPARAGKVKGVTYESGMDPVGTARKRFNVRFYLIAMVFLVFDIEIIFLYPWGVLYRDLGAFGLVAVVLFVVPVVVSLVYEIANGGLDWGPVDRVRRLSPMVSEARTSETTIRRVGLEGRDEAGEAREEVAV